MRDRLTTTQTSNQLARLQSFMIRNFVPKAGAPDLFKLTFKF